MAGSGNRFGYGPKTTLCMMRPGSSVNSPAITRAPENSMIMHTASGSTASV